MGALNNGRAPLGFRNDAGTLVVIEAEAAIVRRIFSEYLAGRSQQAITRGLAREGITTKYGGEWHQGTAAKVLKNPAYMDAIVDGETWHAAERCARQGARAVGVGARRPDSTSSSRA